LRDIPAAERPSLLPLLYYSFRLMVAIGFIFLIIALVSGWLWAKGRLSAEHIVQQRLMLKLWLIAAPLGFVAVETGWIVREVGRQPWVIYGVMRTVEGASRLPAASVGVTLITFVVTYVLLFVVFVIFFLRLVRHGPDMQVLPGQSTAASGYAEK